MAREKGMGSLQREKSGRWTVRVCINGKRFSRSTRTSDRQLAENFLQRILAPLGLGEKRLALAEVWHYYEISPNRRELAKATLEHKRIVWMHFARWFEKWHPEVTQLAHVTADAVGEYLVELRGSHTASTYNGRVCVLREIFRVLSEKAGLVDDPWEGVRLREDDSHSRRELSIEEVRSILEVASRPSAALKIANGGAMASSADWQLLFLVGLYTGLRLGDCCKLEWKDIWLDRGIIQKIPQKTRKYAHGIPVTIPIHPVLHQALKERNGAEKGPFVLPIFAEWYKSAKWRLMSGIKTIFKAAGVRTSVMIEGRNRATPEATFHSFRHTFVSLSANAGVPIPVIQSIVGHTSSAMTRHYYHESEEALRKAIATIPAL